MPRPDLFRILVDGNEIGLAAMLAVACDAADALVPAGAVEIVDRELGTVARREAPHCWEVMPAGLPLVGPVHPPRRAARARTRPARAGKGFAWQQRADLQ